MEKYRVLYLECRSCIGTFHFLIRTPSPQEMHVTEKPFSDYPRMEEKSSEKIFCPNLPFLDRP